MSDPGRPWRAWLGEFVSMLVVLLIWLFILYYAMCGMARE